PDLARTPPPAPPLPTAPRRRHPVLALLGGGAHALQRLARPGPLPLALHAPHAVGLPLLHLERHAQEVRRALLGHFVAVHAHHGLLAPVDLLLVGVGRVGDLALGVAGLDRLHHAAEAVDPADVLASFAFDSVSERFDRPAAAERVDDVRDPALLG